MRTELKKIGAHEYIGDCRASPFVCPIRLEVIMLTIHRPSEAEVTPTSTF